MTNRLNQTELPHPAESRRNILLVDDHAGFRGMVAKVLGLAPGEFREAENGRDAVDCCCEACPSLIVMDYAMPEMDGIEATRRILRVHPDARIIILTQHDEAPLRELALHAGAAAFHSKMQLLELPAVCQRFCAARRPENR